MSDYRSYQIPPGWYTGAAEAYANSTELRAQAIEAQREAESEAAEQEREYKQTEPHRAVINQEFSQWICMVCGLHENNPIHTRKET